MVEKQSRAEATWGRGCSWEVFVEGIREFLRSKVLCVHRGEEECCKAVCRVSRPMKKLSCWSSANARWEKWRKLRECNDRKELIYKEEKSQACCLLSTVLHSPLRMQSQVNEILGALFRIESKLSYTPALLFTISSSTADCIHPLCFKQLIHCTSVSHITVVPVHIPTYPFTCQVCVLLYSSKIKKNMYTTH